MAQVVGDNYSRKKTPPVKAQAASRPVPTGGFMQSEMNSFEADRLRNAAAVGGSTGGLSLNLERLAKEIAADRRISKENNKGGVKKAAGNSLLWLIDQLSRTGNAVSTGLLYEGRVEQKNEGFVNPLPGIAAFAKGAKEGFLLNERSNIKEVFNEGGYTGRGAGTIGFIGDLTLDPLNLIPGGYIAKTIKGGKKNALGTAEGAARVGQEARAGVASRAGASPSDISIGGPKNVAGSYVIGRGAAAQAPEAVLAETRKTIDGLKKKRTSKAAKKQKDELEQIADTLEATITTGSKAAPETQQAISNLSALATSLLAKTSVRIEPLRSADEAARLRPILASGSGRSATDPVDAVSLDEMPQDVIDTIKYDARKRADAWFDRTTNVKALKDEAGKDILDPKTGKPKFGPAGGASIAELRREVALKGSDPSIVKLGVGRTGADVDISPAANLRAIEKSEEYQAALKRGLESAIKAHNKALPKAKKTAPILERTLAAIPPRAEEIVSAAAKGDNVAIDGADFAADRVGKTLAPIDEAGSKKRLQAEHDSQVARLRKEGKIPTPVGAVDEASNLEKVTTPLAPVSKEAKLEAAASASFRLDNRLEKAIDGKIANIYKQIKSGFINPKGQKGHKFFSPMKQANLYDSIRDAVVDRLTWSTKRQRDDLLRDPEVRQFVREQYIRAETIMAVQHGLEPLEWKRGVPGNAGARRQALSDFFNYVSVEDEMAGNAKFWTEIMNGADGSGLAERLFAGVAIEETPKVAQVIEEIGDTLVDAANTLPDAKLSEALKEAPKAAVAAADDLSPSAKEVVNDNVAALANGVAESKGEVWKVRYDQQAARVADDSGSARLGLREAEAVDRVLGIGNIGNRSLLKLNLTKAGKMTPGMTRALSDASHKARAAGERFTIRFDAGHGFDPFFQATRRAVANSAAGRSQQHMAEISKTFAGMKAAQIKDTLNDVQMGKLDTPQAQQASEFLDTIFNPETGWLKQDGITMKEYEEQLHRLYPTKTNAKGKVDSSWRPQVVESPVDKLKKAKPDATWHDSYKYWEWTDNPAADLLKVRLAFENALAQRYMYEDLVNTFGIAKGSRLSAAQAKKEGWTEVKRFHPALDGQLFPPEIAGQINKYEDMFRMRKDSTSEFMKRYDKLLQGWKTGVTIYSPSHHIRNLVGDMWMAYFVDGVKNPVHYKQAMRALLHEKPELDPRAFGVLDFNKSSDKDTLFKMANGTPVTAEQFRIMWRDMGGHQAFASADNLNDLEKVKGRIPTIIREKVASPIEDVTRMGHAIALMKRSRSSDPVAAMRDIIPRVNRAHVDYGNLTDFERGTMRRLIPFYTWQRGVFPVLLDSMMRNPQRVMVYPKAMTAFSESQGYQRDDTNYFPQSDQISPDWMTEGGGVPFAKNKRGNVLYADPSNPFNDAIFKGMLLHPKEAIGGMLSPFVRVPAEMFIRDNGQRFYKKDSKTPEWARGGTQFFGNIPIKDRREYVEDNIPILNNFVRLSRRDPIHGFQQRENTRERVDEQGTNVTSLINWLTAGGLQENTERRREFATKLKQREQNG